MKAHRIENGTAILQRAWGMLLIDAEDLPKLDGWGLDHKSVNRSNGYVRLRKRRRKHTERHYLSRILVNAPQGLDVDHINHNTLDNRKSNLRVCTNAENRRNCIGHANRTLSKFKGVTYHDARAYNPRCSGVKPWRAYTRIMGKRHWFGYHATEQEAAMAYNRNAARLFGEFACFNRFDACPVLALLGPQP